MSRLRRIVVAVASAACVAVALTGGVTAPAFAQSASTQSQTQVQTAPVTATAVKLPAAIAASGPCGDGNGYNGATRFWRCTGSSVTSDWVASTTCNQGEYNADTGSYYNAYGAINNCSGRVWFHEFMYPKDQTAGWAICIPPASAVSWIFGGVNEKPQNFMISANTAFCTPTLP